MHIFAFGDRGSIRGIAIDKFQCVFGQLTQVIVHRFVGAMDGSIEGGVIDVNPEGLFGSRPNDGILGKGEGVRVVGRWSLVVSRWSLGKLKIRIGGVGDCDSVITIRTRGIVVGARDTCQQQENG